MVIAAAAKPMKSKVVVLFFIVVCFLACEDRHILRMSYFTERLFSNCRKATIFARQNLRFMESFLCNDSVGLVLEGGGMRGLFTSGVLDVMLENGIAFPCAAGVSAGACFGVNFKSRQIGRALRYNLRMVGDRRYMSLHSFVTSGDYVNSEFCYHTMPMEIDVFDVEEYARNPMEFHVVCTDADSGKAVYKNVERINRVALDWIRASASLPILSRPVLLDGLRLLDGGLADAIPVRYMERLGFERNVVVLTQPLGYRKRPTSHAWLYRLLCREYPTVAESLLHRPEMYNAQLDYVEAQAKNGRILLIAPPEKLGIGRVEQDPVKLKSAYDLGRKACEMRLPALQDFLNR